MNRKNITSLYLALKIYFTIIYMCAYMYVGMWAWEFRQRPEAREGIRSSKASTTNSREPLNMNARH